jgi:predicted hydrocarbon binding protein
MNSAKGAVVLSTIEFLRSTRGTAVIDRVLQRLDEEDRQEVEGVQATDSVPLERLYRLWHAADEELGTEDPAWMERAGAYSIESAGVQLYGGILRKPSPAEFLMQPISLFRLFYQSGSMEVVERENARAVLRLVGFPAVDTLFCRRQSGGLRRAVELAGGDAAEVRHVRCATEGDAFCEWELRWAGKLAEPQGGSRRTPAAPTVS